MPIASRLCSVRMTVEVRHLRSLLAIADHGTITAAARELHISQPALSRTLAQLERSVAVQLVDRSTHHLTLTPAGRQLISTARRVVHDFDDAVSSVSAAVPALRFGHNWSSATHAAAIVRAWRDAYPDRPIRSRRGDERMGGVLAGHVDVALVRGSVADPGLASKVIDTEPRVAALPADHRLAGAIEVSLADLAHETLIVSSPTGTTTLDLWDPASRPTIGADLPTIDDWLIAIATSTGVGITAASTAVLHPHPDVRFVHLSDAPLIPVAMVWPRRNAHPHAKAFVAVARNAMEHTGTGSKAPGDRRD
jgi:DNA-binding transcriptional LysR family regulator